MRKSSTTPTSCVQSVSGVFFCRRKTMRLPLSRRPPAPAFFAFDRSCRAARRHHFLLVPLGPLPVPPLFFSFRTTTRAGARGR